MHIGMILLEKMMDKLVEMNMGFQSLVGSQSFFGSFRSGKLKLNKRDVIRQVFRPA